MIFDTLVWLIASIVGAMIGLWAYRFYKAVMR
jgi:hypothetical protein